MMMNVDQIYNAVTEAVQAKFGAFEAECAVVLGSGLGDFVDQITESDYLNYSDIPFFKKTTVQGHAGRLCVGLFQGQPIVCLQGRPHWYEGVTAEVYIALIAAVKACGVKTLVVTNAVGGIRSDLTVGDVVLIEDHINLQGRHPLVGLTPPPFISMDSAYDVELREQFIQLAQAEQLPLKKGVYCGVLGPSFETPAEIQAFKSMGADLVAMSMIPEVLTARYFELRVLGLSIVSNPAAGLSQQTLGHDVTLAGVQKGSKQLLQLLTAFVKGKE
ncbi:MAG: purine-nucleoside phosphorylase [Legionellales bacterium]|nr:purine-nucleoside phosphorylase [Legionellales bacterium]|tara:strand:+ start:106 stop:924 length:819 start_codon:yes stop_codon:yes gene_type:complete